MTSPAMRSAISRKNFISARVPTSGIMTSGLTLTPAFVSSATASKIALICIS